jgi:hypothetical protein
MFYDDQYTRVIAVAERSCDSDYWVDTKSFSKNTPVEQIVEWAKNKPTQGKLIIVIDETDATLNMGRDG